MGGGGCDSDSRGAAVAAVAVAAAAVALISSSSGSIRVYVHKAWKQQPGSTGVFLGYTQSLPAKNLAALVSTVAVTQLYEVLVWL